MERPRSGNRRDEAARLNVLHAADDLLAERGFGALTVEAIARRAGVAKQTIYRWWPGKVEILLDTLIDDSEKLLPVPAEGATAAGIREYLHSYVQFLADDAGKVLLALLAEAQHNPAAAKLFHERYLGPRQEQETALIHRAIESGAISPGLDADSTRDALIGPIVYRTLTGSGVTDEFVDALVAALL